MNIINGLSYLPRSMRQQLYFGIQTVIGSRVRPVWEEFLSWERLTPAELDQAVEKKLSNILEAATTGSEYYRNFNLPRRSGETARQWLKQFPILERLKVRENFTSIVRDDLRSQITSREVNSPAGYSWLMVKTGGTTGMPTTVVHDANTRDWGRATRLYGLKQCGFPLGKPYIKLWGSERDLLQQQISLQQRVLQALHAEIPLNAFRAREEDLQRHLKVMLAHPEIKHLMSYVDAAASLAIFIRDKNLRVPKFETIMACAGTVTPGYRALLEETFSAEVFDKYGSRDCCDLACECKSHTGLHVYSPQAVIEIVDEQGRECAPGQSGRILVTMLNNRSFPMIRYSIGDLGVWAEPGACACGSPFPRMQSVLGREDDMLSTQDGTLQSSSFVRHFVGVSLNRQLIHEWQFEQTGPKDFIFRYVPLKTEGLEEDLNRLKQSIRLVFGASANIEMCRVNEIPPSASGKIRWIINRCHKLQ
ncbi:MAG: hypothetical protein HYZ84_06425 [Candidatus Omnitrophica bacterium]|nr:hypothetical protein [Candidatus Omnitrophota bacterium]